jgi:competence protein ComEA
MHALKGQLLQFLRKHGISNQKAAFFVLIAVVVGVMLFNSLQESKPKPVASRVAVSPTAMAPKLFVHVVGAVQNPGLYQLDFNSRVYDAVQAAGGFGQDADQASVNLARVISDGEQIIVAKVGDAAAAGQVDSGSTALININRANATELDSLPGIGPAIAGRIVDWRTANGGFKKKEDLLQVQGIGQKLFAQIKDLVTF